MTELMQLIGNGLNFTSLAVEGAVELTGCKKGKVTLAVNGRAGRRVACVLDAEGTTLEVLDMEGDDAEEEDEMETGDGADE